MHQTRRAALALLMIAAALAACTDDNPGYVDNGENNANNDPNNDPNNDFPNNDGNNDVNNDVNNDPNNAPNNDPNNDVLPDLIGAPCGSNQDCGFGGFCVTPEAGFADGYCVSTCDPDDPIPCDGEGNPCLRLGENDLCVDGCQSHDDCREGYGCVDLLFNGQPFCFPVECRQDADCGPGRGCARGACGNAQAVTGDACQVNADCQPGGFCIPEVNDQGMETGFGDGYCTQVACQSDDDCVGDAYCAFNGEAFFCLAACQGGDDCRPRYSCLPFDGGQGCLPGQCADDSECPEGSQCVNALCGNPQATLGDPCASNADCLPGDFCILPGEPNTDGFVGGYCTRFGCEPLASGSCGDDGHCVPIDQNGNGLCLDACQEDTDCREGGLYECRLLFPQLPEDRTTCLPVNCFDDQDCPQDFSCDLGTSLCVPANP